MFLVSAIKRRNNFRYQECYEASMKSRKEEGEGEEKEEMQFAVI